MSELPQVVSLAPCFEIKRIRSPFERPHSYLGVPKKARRGELFGLAIRVSAEDALATIRQSRKKYDLPRFVKAL